MVETSFPPTDQAWQSRLAGLNPQAYAKTRNHLQGAVSRISPYLTHGFLGLQEAVAQVRSHSRLEATDKIFSEFAWRSFFHHVWDWAGDGIFKDMRPGLPGIRYRSELPADIREGRTGLAVIDQAVAALYETGYLHNHARMWLASYVVHLRHVHWHAGADWMFGHLLDGDLASNHLSWQWVAATFSVKPYLFNADNVARFAPAAWQCPGTPLDTSYEALEQMARGLDEDGRSKFESLAQYARQHSDAMEEPFLHSVPPPELQQGVLRSVSDLQTWLASSAWASDLPRVELVHAWALRSAVSSTVTTGTKPLRLGLIHLPAHRDWPWSHRRWQFVISRMWEVCDAVFMGDVPSLQPALSCTQSLLCLDSPGSPLTREAIAGLHPSWEEPIPWLTTPSRPCQSFSSYIRAVRELR